MSVKNKTKAFTLIEIIIAITVSSILLSGLIILFQAGLDSWDLATSQAILQDTTDKLINRIIEGDYKYDGLREVMEIKSTTEKSIRWLPWHKQKINSIELNKTIFLNQKRSIISPPPVLLYFNEEKNNWHIAKGTLILNADRTNESVIYTDKNASGKKGRLIYYPDEINSHRITQTIFFDENEKKIMLKTGTEIKPLIKYPEDLYIEEFRLSFLDSTGKELKNNKFNYLQTGKSPISAILIHITARINEERFSLRSLVNLRKKGIASAGTILSPESSITIPSSEDIKTLSVIDIHGVKDKGTVKIKIKNKAKQETLLYTLLLKQQDKKLMLNKVVVEYPPGKPVFSRQINTPVNQGFNLLTIDPSCRYDYNIDNNISEQINFTKQSELEFDSNEAESILLLVR